MSLFGFGTVTRNNDRIQAPGGRESAPPLLIEEFGWFDVVDLPSADHARIAAVRAAGQVGLDEVRIGELSSAVDELGGNLYQHAGGGRVAVRGLWRSGVPGMEIVVVDGGPGMQGFPGCSSAQCSDEALCGDLGAAVRLASRHDGYSLPGRGTVITMQFWPRSVYPTAFTATGLTRPMAGESVSGDQFAVILRDDGPILLVVDGLGHGPMAAQAAGAVTAAFHAARTDNPADLIDEIHASIADTRGAAVAVAKLEPALGVVRFAGLGNIAAAVIAQPGGAEDLAAAAGCVDARRIGMVSHPGIAGHQRGEVYESCYPIGTDDLVVMHSDGVTDRWDLAAYPGLAHHEPLVVAATLLRDAGVRRDDACVLVAKCA